VSFFKLIKLLNKSFTCNLKFRLLTAFNNLKITSMTGDKTNAKPDDKKKVYRPYPKKADDGTKPKEGIPMLKYGKGNNFYKFKAALAEVAQEKFGNLGRLIEEDKYYEPEYTPMVAPAGVVLDADELKLLKSAAIKEFASKVAKMEADRPKLYGLIRRHMSVESKDEVAQDKDYPTWSKALDAEKLWQAIVNTHKIDCLSNINEVMELMARKAYQNICQGAFETLAQFSIRFSKTYKGYENTVVLPTGVKEAVSEKVRAMDFFNALDQGKYGTFKTSMLYGWNTKAITPPTTVNEIYRMAGSWVKVAPKTEGGLAAPYVTIEGEAALRGKMKRNGNPKKGNKEKPNEEPKKPKDLSHIECHKCHEMGHYANKCPQKQADEGGFVNATWQEEQEGQMSLSVRWEDAEVQEVTVNNVMNATQGILPTEVLLDTAADISVIHPMLLEDVQEAERKIRVKGVGGTQLIVKDTGKLDGFFKVYASTETKANVLSFAAVEAIYDITYVCGEAFVVHMPDRDLVFKKGNNLYVAEWYAEGTVESTVQENEVLYSKEQVCRAKEAHEFLKNSGYPSLGEAVHLLMDGNVRGVPMLMREDLERAYKIYGEHPAYVRGKLTRKTVKHMPVDVALRSSTKDLKVYADVMHIDTQWFLVSVSDPLNLTMQTKIDSESRNELGLALQGQLLLLHTRG
jgi:hypothetical protein